MFPLTYCAFRVWKFDTISRGFTQNTAFVQHPPVVEHLGVQSTRARTQNIPADHPWSCFSNMQAWPKCLARRCYREANGGQSIVSPRGQTQHVTTITHAVRLTMQNRVQLASHQINVLNVLYISVTVCNRAVLSTSCTGDVKAYPYP